MEAPLTRRPAAALLFVVALLAPTRPTPAQDPTRSVADRLWRAGSLAERLRIASAIADTAPPFEATYAALRGGPTRSADVPTGRLSGRLRIDGVDHPYLLGVPATYAPGRDYPVRVYLHGGVGRRERPTRGGWWREPDRVARDDTISLFPASWADSQWWHESQRRNLRALLDTVKRDYSIDENRVHLFGVSDGGTGVWYLAFRDPTPWAGLVPMIGHPAVLASPRVGVEGQMHASNLASRSFLVFNGGVDRLYPSRSVRPYLSLFEALGADLEFVDRVEDGHTVSWWPDEAERIERYLAAAARDPLPDRVDWATDGSAGSARLHWLVIEDLRPAAAGDHVFPPDERPLSPAAGAPIIGFPRPRPFGRVRAIATANSIRVFSRGVARVRLLLSPEQFDLDRPLRVQVNEAAPYEVVVQRDLGLLLEFAARDLDRTMLFGASLRLDL